MSRIVPSLVGAALLTLAGTGIAAARPHERRTWTGATVTATSIIFPPYPTPPPVASVVHCVGRGCP